MGHGRTTTGMVIATLIYLNRIGASGTFFFVSVKFMFYDCMLLQYANEPFSL